MIYDILYIIYEILYIVYILYDILESRSVIKNETKGTRMVTVAQSGRQGRTPPLRAFGPFPKTRYGLNAQWSLVS